VVGSDGTGVLAVGAGAAAVAATVNGGASGEPSCQRRNTTGRFGLAARSETASRTNLKRQCRLKRRHKCSGEPRLFALHEIGIDEGISGTWNRTQHVARRDLGIDTGLAGIRGDQGFKALIEIGRHAEDEFQFLDGLEGRICGLVGAARRGIFRLFCSPCAPQRIGVTPVGHCIGE
jgi:hypothetical protein